MNNIAEIICTYTRGEASLEATNTALKNAGSDLLLNPEKNGMTPEDLGRFGLLDTGTGSFDKVEVLDGHLVNCDCGGMSAFCIFNGRTYTVQGDTLLDEQ